MKPRNHFNSITPYRNCLETEHCLNWFQTFTINLSDLHKDKYDIFVRCRLFWFFDKDQFGTVVDIAHVVCNDDKLFEISIETHSFAPYWFHTIKKYREKIKHPKMFLTPFSITSIFEFNSFYSIIVFTF